MNDTVLEGLDCLSVYIVNIIIASKVMETHKQQLKQVFERLDEFEVHFNMNKCASGQSKVEYLGYEVSTDGVRSLQAMVDAINEFPRPETVQPLRRFMRMVNCYRLHLPHAVQYQTILNGYLKKEKKG